MNKKKEEEEKPANCKCDIHIHEFQLMYYERQLFSRGGMYVFIIIFER